MDDMVFYGIPAAGLIAALVELAKRSFGLPSRWAAPMAVAVGLIFALAAWLDDPSRGTWLQMVLFGVITGLTASGLYSGGKAITE